MTLKCFHFGYKLGIKSLTVPILHTKKIKERDSFGRGGAKKIGSVSTYEQSRTFIMNIKSINAFLGTVSLHEIPYLRLRPISFTSFASRSAWSMTGSMSTASLQSKKYNFVSSILHFYVYNDKKINF